MARPPKYDWGVIEADYKSGMDIEKLCLKNGIEKRTLQNKVYAMQWEINSEANAIISGLNAVSCKIGALKETNPELIEAVYDRIKVESEFDISAGSLAIKIMKGLHTVVDNGKSYEKVNVGGGIQQLEPVEMGGGHYLDVANAAYRAKELIKGKDITSSQNINVQTNVQSNTKTTLTKEDAHKSYLEIMGG